MKPSTHVLTALLFFSLLIGPQANAAQKITYTLTVPFQYSYEEKGSFKPPVKLSQSNVKFALTDNCNVVVGKKPVVEVRGASGKVFTSESMRSSHRLTSANWGKDESGENKFQVQGICTFIADFTKKFPASNFYQFFVSAGDSYQSRWSFPYTPQQLASAKGGIQETRFLNDLRTPGAFTPVPEIEAPQIKSLVCSQGKLFASNSSGEDGDGETVQVAYFMVINGIYRPSIKEVSSPSVEQIGQRVQSNNDFFVQVDGLSNIELISENTPAFVTWRRPEERNFSTTLRISYSNYAAGEQRKTVKEKTYEIQISNDCKNAKATTS